MKQTVTFKSQQQLIFASLSLPCRGAPCIIVSHGMESSKDGSKWPVLARYLYEAGFACLRFSHRGCGEGAEKSQGEFADTTLSSRIQDYRAAIDYIETAGVDTHRLGAVGSSFGGMVALAAGDIRLKALAILSTPCRFQMPSEEFLKAYRNDDLFDLPSGNKIKAGFWRDIQEYDMCRAAASLNRPLLIVHGSADELVPVDNAREIYECARKLRRLEIVAGASHRFDNPDHLERFISLSLDWFKQYL
ncbi:MAG: alpha/beta fold hydrolase [Chloroflexota bacterium]